MLSLTIHGAPRTKKNSSRFIVAGGRRRIIPSKAHEQWFRGAMQELLLLRAQAVQGGASLPLDCPVCVKATFYRDRNSGDLLNYEQALADALEASWIIEDDKLIVSWDGSRLEVDASRPRIEVEIVRYERRAS